MGYIEDVYNFWDAFFTGTLPGHYRIFGYLWLIGWAYCVWWLCFKRGI